MKALIIPLSFLFFISIACRNTQNNKLIVGAEQPEQYIPLLKGKEVGMVVNHTACIGEVHLVDFLLENEIQIKRIFAPEHGFRGEAAPGEKLDDGIDPKTNIPLVSIYGSNKKPSKKQLDGIEIMVFDIQDVGCRFYTYISTLFYVMEACAENNIPLLVLDRPNPNGEYVAGPILEKEFESFVGLLPVPVVHGCTIGELAQMINGEGWITSQTKCNLTVVPVKNYNHNMQYEPPILPSPNLPNLRSIKLYPYLCFFEATKASIGRGTDLPFQIIGYPNEKFGDYSFVPNEIEGVALNPIQEGKKCFGENLSMDESLPTCLLEYFLEYYNNFEVEEEFLSRERWFNLLIGNESVLKEIRNGKSCIELEEMWAPELDKYKLMRKEYLLYPDFE